MTKKEMRNTIFNMLGGAFSNGEFRLKKSDESFVRMIANGTQSIGLVLLDYHPDFEFSLLITIRLNDVEEIFHHFSGAQPKYHSLSTTTTTRFEHFTGQSSKYPVRTVEDVEKLRDFFSIIQTKIVSFLDNLKDARELDKAINCDYPGISIQQEPYGAMHSVILAKLAGNPDFDRLVSAHRLRMGFSTQASNPFNQLVEYLRRL